MEQMNIQWYPGHMTKTRRQMEQDLKLVDAVCELLDARIPISSRNPDLAAHCGPKPRQTGAFKPDGYGGSCRHPRLVRLLSRAGFGGDCRRL